MNLFNIKNFDVCKKGSGVFFHSEVITNGSFHHSFSVYRMADSHIPTLVRDKEKSIFLRFGLATSLETPIGHADFGESLSTFFKDYRQEVEENAKKLLDDSANLLMVRFYRSLIEKTRKPSTNCRGL